MMKRTIRIGTTIACWACALLAARSAFAGVVVLQNWTASKISVMVCTADGMKSRQTIAPTDIAAIPCDRPVLITLGEGADARTYQAAVNTIHYLGIRNGKAELAHLRLPGEEDNAAPSAQQPAQTTPARPGAAPRPPAMPPVPAHPPGPIPLGQVQPTPGIYKIPVAIMVDTADPRSQAVWEKKLRKRLEDASDIFEHHCRVRFVVVAVGIWQSNPALHSFNDALMDFAQKVRPYPARLVIGFTSRYDWLREETHLGGTHGALGSHILIRESVGRVSEPERLEVLVHELGHFLGAAHTADQHSVMRPKLGDRQSTAKSFRIGFDAPNTLVMNLIAEEMRTRHIMHPSMLLPADKRVVRGAYMALAQTIPQDPVSTSSLASLGPPQSPAEPPSIASPELIHGARFVVNALAAAARQNRNLPVSSKDPKKPVWRTDDELTAYYIRCAAAAARRLPPRAGPSAFLLGLGVALDDSNYVHDKPALNEVWQKIEPDSQRQIRMSLMGAPTMLKRHEVVRRFTMSAALVVLTGQQGAEAADLGKELSDSRNGNGFSFADLCAGNSGAIFASHVLNENISLEEIAKNFKVEDYMPRIDGLPDDVSWDTFMKQYGEASSETFQRERGDIYHRIMALPPYRAPEKKTAGVKAEKQRSQGRAEK